MEDKVALLKKLEHKNARLSALVKKYKQSHHLQHALIQLSEQASNVAELTLLYPAIHDILQDYVPSKSFYVVLLNPFTNTLELSYFADEKDGIAIPLILVKVLQATYSNRGKQPISAVRKCKRLLTRARLKY